MKTKKFIKILCAVLIVVALTVSLTACLRIGMRKDYIEKRLNKAGATINHQRTSPMTEDGQNAYNIEDIMLAKLEVADGPNDDGEKHEDELYIFFCGNSESAGWVEEQCKSYRDANKEQHPNWDVYRQDETVMIGHYKILTIVRTY